MRCSSIQAQLADLAANELSDWQRWRLRRHCAGCRECHDAWEQTQKLWIRLQDVASAPTPETVRGAIFTHLDQLTATGAPLDTTDRIFPKPGYPHLVGVNPCHASVAQDSNWRNAMIKGVGTAIAIAILVIIGGYAWKNPGIFKMNFSRHSGNQGADSLVTNATNTINNQIRPQLVADTEPSQLSPPAKQRIQVGVITSATHEERLKAMAKTFNNSQSKYFVYILVEEESRDALHKLLARGVSPKPAGWFVSVRSLMDREAEVYPREHGGFNIVHNDTASDCRSIDSPVMVFLIREDDRGTLESLLHVDNPWWSIIHSGIKIAFARQGSAGSAIMADCDMVRDWREYENRFPHEDGFHQFIHQVYDHCWRTQDGTFALAKNFADQSANVMREVKAVYTYADTAESFAKESRKDSDPHKHLTVVCPTTSPIAERRFAVLQIAEPDQREGARTFMKYVADNYPKTPVPPGVEHSVQPSPYWVDRQAYTGHNVILNWPK